MVTRNIELARRVAEWSEIPVAVIGDVILDRYTWGKVSRISPEAPVPVVLVGPEELRLGGAANVAANLAAAGGAATLCGVVGQDASAARLMGLLTEHGIVSTGITVDASRPTVVKERVMAHNQQLLRIDRELYEPLAAAVEADLLRKIDALAGVKVWVVSDYGKGTLSRRVLEKVIATRATVLVDPKGKDYARYRGATLVTPNKKEAEEATGLALSSPKSWRAAATQLIESLSLQAAVITLGAEGLYGRTAAGDEVHVPADARAVFDVTGAGDTVIALMALALAAGEPLFDALKIANAGAGVVVGKVGTAPVSKSELARALDAFASVQGQKVFSRPELLERLLDHRSRRERVVFTNGCFDVLHEGHVDYLRFAKSRGSVLVVGVNDDASVRRLKGTGRPINSLAARGKVLAALQDVDYVTSFAEDTPAELIRAISPDVLVKGEDWREKGVVGREWVESHGGEVVLAPLTPGRSTSALIEAMRAGDRRGEPRP
jgi:D-beta-D-heptose 7-phosphate kinase / D-beta-D-heptose 1-phosphate adenosyltransferase